MLVRRCLTGLLILGCSLLVCDCNSPELVSIAITPTTQYFTYTPGLTVQFRAIGTYAQGNHPKTTQDITGEVTWKVNSPGIATVSSTGLVTTTGTEYGTDIVSANMNGYTGLIVANANVNVCQPGQTLSGAGCS